MSGSRDMAIWLIPPFWQILPFDILEKLAFVEISFTIYTMDVLQTLTNKTIHITFLISRAHFSCLKHEII